MFEPHKKLKECVDKLKQIAPSPFQPPCRGQCESDFRPTAPPDEPPPQHQRQQQEHNHHRPGIKTEIVPTWRRRRPRAPPPPPPPSAVVVVVVAPGQNYQSALPEAQPASYCVPPLGYPPTHFHNPNN